MVTKVCFISKFLLILVVVMQIVIGCNNPTRIEAADKTLIINDTLKLSAYFDECGEFGGHREQMRIYKIRGTIPGGSSDTLGADFYVDTVKCASDNRKRVFVRIKSKVLTVDDKRLLLNYMGDLLKKALNEGMYSNAGKVYNIKCGMPKIDISYLDDGQDWDGFYKMKRFVFSKK